MTEDDLILSHPKHQLFARQFEIGARKAAELKGITVVIDVFRASNTMLELMDAGAQVRPVVTIKEALETSDDWIRVGESEGNEIGEFDFDNSPVTIHQNAAQFSGKYVVIRTTNGTRGILAALGAEQVLVGAFRNFTAIVNYCYEAILKQVPVTFVAMGTLEVERIEDRYCAEMFFIRIMEKLQEEDYVEKLSQEGNNPWVRNWKKEIMDERGNNTTKRDDYLFSLELDTMNIVPQFNSETGYLEPIT